MKNILRTIFVFVVGAVFLVSCEKKETNFDAMFNDWDPNNTTYYLQFVDPVQKESRCQLSNALMLHWRWRKQASCRSFTILTCRYAGRSSPHLMQAAPGCSSLQTGATSLMRYLPKSGNGRGMSSPT